MEIISKKTYRKATKKYSGNSLKKSKKNKPMSAVSKKIQKGLEEIFEYTQGKRTLRTKLIELPEPPLEYGAKEIRQIREKGDYSQGVFAIILNVSKRTVQSWESGSRSPSHSALRLLEIIDKGIYCPSTLA
jgi:putative transcriptional regulator